mgnify:CR=1 FL=1|tara:strand:+ start:116 stop:382 length:267 start_codon:yes stop_codon:yes gene_type:complete
MRREEKIEEFFTVLFIVVILCSFLFGGGVLLISGFAVLVLYLFLEILRFIQKLTKRNTHYLIFEVKMNLLRLLHYYIWCILMMGIFYS